MSFAVVVFTRGDRPALLRKCLDSIQACMPSEGKVVVKTVTGDWNLARMEAMAEADIVAFVDDDDTVVNNSLSICYDVMQRSSAGLVFTDQRQVLVDGSTLNDRVGTRTYDEVCKRPERIHHLSLIRTADVTLPSGPIGHGNLDWYLRTSALEKSGAIHVPIIGYHWLMHPGQLHKQPKSLPPVYLTVSRSGPIPTASL